MVSISELVPHTETVYCAAEMTPPEIEFCVHEHTISETIPRYCDCALGLLGEFWARTATVPVPCKTCCMLCWAAPTTSVSKVSYMCSESWHPWASAEPEGPVLSEPEDAILPEVVGFCGHPWLSVKPLMGTHCCGWLPGRPRGFSFYPCCHPSLSNPCDGLHWPPLTSPKGPSLSHIRVSVAIVGLWPRHPRVYITLVGFHPSHLLAMPPKVSSVSALASS